MPSFITQGMSKDAGDEMTGIVVGWSMEGDAASITQIVSINLDEGTAVAHEAIMHALVSLEQIIESEYQVSQ